MPVESNPEVEVEVSPIMTCMVSFDVEDAESNTKLFSIRELVAVRKILSPLRTPVAPEHVAAKAPMPLVEAVMEVLGMVQNPATSPVSTLALPPVPTESDVEAESAPVTARPPVLTLDDAVLIKPARVESPSARSVE